MTCSPYLPPLPRPGCWACWQCASCAQIVLSASLAVRSRGGSRETARRPPGLKKMREGDDAPAYYLICYKCRIYIRVGNYTTLRVYGTVSVSVTHTRNDSPDSTISSLGL